MDNSPVAAGANAQPPRYTDGYNTASGPAPGPSQTPYPPPPMTSPPYGQPPQAWGPGPPQYPVGQPYYPPPAAGPYGAPYGMMMQPPPPQQQQQQQQQTVVVMGGGNQPVVLQAVESYCGHIALACFVFWCCNWLFGLIAFILAMVASSNAVSDPHGARHLGRASYGVSIAGIVITIVVVAIVVGVLVGGVSSATNYSSSSGCLSSYYRYGGNCYKYRSYYYSYSSCDAISGVYDYVSNYCYYNSY